MARPASSGQVKYVVRLDVDKIRDGGDTSATVHKGDQTDAIPRIDMSVSPGPGPQGGLPRLPSQLSILPMLADIFSLRSITSDERSDLIDMSTTCPLPSLKSMIGALHFMGIKEDEPRPAGVKKRRSRTKRVFGREQQQ
ncbi:uncharacterized protein MAM_04848 [Metarhizium album ARSEF 1941]|uniref:Uncharacterized protein n=1 Tax=Metarhizium album (strain ARSEF 1941) TaxID=1081103 RepID=A0A0B2WMJ9_METAS|nr:uncharacterized protein MAM_04848 [Metarhizium album ARSEF 1941]KHN97251.1 hypothetical protein MAM_04848 [Metarhizium album ARSEF 1941]